MSEIPKEEFWCVAANIKKELPFGPGGLEIKIGLKKFKGGAKVLIVGGYYGMCESVVVTGQHRDTGKYISCIIGANTIENFRIKKIYSPQIIEFLGDFKPNGAYMVSSKGIAKDFLEFMPKWAVSM